MNEQLIDMLMPSASLDEKRLADEQLDNFLRTLGKLGSVIQPMGTKGHFQDIVDSRVNS